MSYSYAREGDEKLMTVQFSELHKILKDPTRKAILKCLNEKAPLTYVELMDLAKVTNTGRFNYHLKILGELIEKQGDGRYRPNRQRLFGDSEL